MVDFSIDVGDTGVAIERPSSGVDYRGLGAIASAFLDREEPKGPTEAEIERGAFASFAEAIDGLRGLSPLQAQARLPSVISAYASQGFSVGTDEANYIKRTLNVDVDNMVMTPEEAQIASLSAALNENPAYYTVAKEQLVSTGVSEPTEDQIFAQAAGNFQRVEAAALSLANSATLSRAQYFETYLPQANGLISNLRDLALAGLDIESGGGNITPQNITAIKAQFAALEAGLTPPAQVTDEDFKPIRAQLDTLKDLITTLETYDETELAALTKETLEPITLAVIKQARELGQTDPLIAQAILTGGFDANAYIEQNYAKVLQSIEAVTAEDQIYTDVFTGQIVNLDLSAVPALPSDPTVLHSPQQLESVEAMNPAEVLELIEFGSWRSHMGTPESMQSSLDARQNFLHGVGQATSAMVSLNTVLDPDTVSRVFDASFFNTLEAATRMDPDRGRLARDQSVAAIQRHITLYSTSAAGELADSLFTIEAGTNKVIVKPGETRDVLQGLADDYGYNGNITAMLNDNFLNVPLSVPQDLGLGNLFTDVRKDLNDVRAYNRDMKVFRDTLLKLGVASSEVEDEILKGLEGGVRPFDISSADSSKPFGSRENPYPIAWEARQSALDTFENLPDGDFFLSPGGYRQIKGRLPSEQNAVDGMLYSFGVDNVMLKGEPQGSTTRFPEDDPFELNEGLTDEEIKEAIDLLSSGDFYVDPRTGDVVRKD